MGPIQTKALTLGLAFAPIASFAQDRSAARIKDLAMVRYLRPKLPVLRGNRANTGNFNAPGPDTWLQRNALLRYR
jgi:hypothetical protein